MNNILDNVKINNIRIDTARLWKLFINRDYFKIKNLYNQYPRCDDLKRKYIIKWIIETTSDFNSALAVQQSFDSLFTFFNTHKVLVKCNLKNIHLYKQDKLKIINDIRFKNFEYCFTQKIDLMKIIFCINNNINVNINNVNNKINNTNDNVNNNVDNNINNNNKIDNNNDNNDKINKIDNTNNNNNNDNYIYYNNINKDKLQLINQRLRILDDLEIPHLDYELIGSNIRIKKIEEMEFKSNEYKFTYICKNISTEILLFLFMNNILNINTLTINKYGNIVVIIPFITTSSLVELVQYKKMYNELLKRNDLNDTCDKFKNLNLSARQMMELENIKR